MRHRFELQKLNFELNNHISRFVNLPAMGRPKKIKNTPVATENVLKPPLMKFPQAMKLADKNSRTIMKISQLMVR